MKPEDRLREIWDAKEVPKEKQDEMLASITAAAQPGAQVGPFTVPRFELTKAGPQAVVPGTPGRVVPDAPLRAKRKQSEKPTLLELYEAEISQGKLF